MSNNQYVGFSHPENAEAVTPNDSTDLPNGGILFVGTGGDLTVNMYGAGTQVVFKNVPDGTAFPYEVTRVYATGTTASDILVTY